MFSDHNKTKLSVFVLNLVILNTLSIQPALALNGGSVYIAAVSDSVLGAGTSAAKTSLAKVNEGTAVLADFATAGVTKAVIGNKTAYDSAIATAIRTKGSSLTLEEVQTQVGIVNTVVTTTALAAINGGKEVFADFATAGITKAVPGNKAGYDSTIATAIKTKGSSLTLEEMQTQIDSSNAAAATTALAAINAGTEVFADFATAVVTKAVVGNKAGYDSTISTARKTKGSSLTLAEVQAQVDVANAAAVATALVAINAGTEVFVDFASAGITKSIVRNKAGYDSTIATARKTKGSSLTLAEVQAQVDVANSAAAATALAAINGRTEVFADFATAGVTGAVVKIKASYDTAIAAARKAKGANLTLAELQTQVEGVNAAVATTALAAINASTDLFADFATAGVTGTIAKRKIYYDIAISTALKTKGTNLTLAEVQTQVSAINCATVTDALAAINGGLNVFADFATAGVIEAVAKRKIDYDIAVATAIELKGSDLTLEEVQTQIRSVNAAAATTALTAINQNQDVFADFATAGVIGAVIKNKIAYDTAIVTATKTKGSDLTLAEVQTQVTIVNTAEHI